MKAFTAFALLFLSSLIIAQAEVITPYDDIELVVINPTPTLEREQLPAEWFWNNVNGKSYLTIVKNHHIPWYCGACYAFGSTSTISDRIKIMRDAAFPDIVVAPQVVISCASNHGCHGGNPLMVFKYVHDFGITDETCSTYHNLGAENGAPCTEELKCSVCDDDGNCYVPDSYPIYTVSEYGKVTGEVAMMNEIVARGPIACMIMSDPLETYTGGIIKEFYDTYQYDHVISVVGYGTEEDGTPYWLVRNSWGNFWGEDGFFRIHRGNNSLGMEGSCFWVVPEDTWTQEVRNYTTPMSEDSIPDQGFLAKKNEYLSDIIASHKSCLKFDNQFLDFTSKSGNLPFANVDVTTLPTAFSWDNHNGVNFLSWSVNEHAPKFCASCWAEATLAALADRIMIARNSTFPSVGLSTQVVLNCQAGGDCTGGDPLSVYKFANEHGVPEYSCQNYGADIMSFGCEGRGLCQNCNPPAPARNGSNPDNCTAITDFRMWKVSDYGKVSGLDNIKKAIFQGGPIACTMTVTAEFETYNGGVFSQVADATLVPNHVVSIVGWDVDDNGVEHWIVRNSWGSFWGVKGYFRIQTGSDNLGIENDCMWATPIVNDVFVSRFNPKDADTVYITEL